MNEPFPITSIWLTLVRGLDMPTWFTIDTDDLRHLPQHLGHPTRIIVPFHGGLSLSEEFRIGWATWLSWMGNHDGAITMFVISDMLDDVEFQAMLADALERFPRRLTVGCHGHTHRSWSAWGEDEDGFSAMLAASTKQLKAHAGDAYRPYFRAPNGYIAPWMAKVLAEKGYTVDSSVNPSWLVKSKAGGAPWKAVQSAMSEAKVVERAWMTRWSLPVNGPALFRFPLSWIANRAWRRVPPLLGSAEADRVEDESFAITTVYCHVLDFARNSGGWNPPLPGNRPK